MEAATKGAAMTGRRSDTVDGYVDIDPVVIRKELARQREKGVGFERAWLEATANVEPSGHPNSLYAFMRKHFRAAYYGDESKQGRSGVPERDVSAAVSKTTGITPTVANHEHCRSGDGCDRLAVRGRFGRKWCDHHADELERIGKTFRKSLAKADPRKGGNTALYTHKAA